ncbi:MAG: ADOP family duplicated permease, partial [Blastocatellia bacterium]
ANVANLLLARAAARRREMAVRAALGAPARRLLRQALTESLLLAGLGGAGGTLVAWWGADALLAFAPASLPRLNAIGVDAQALSFTLLTSLLTGVLFGLAPALRSSKPDLTSALKEGGQAARAGRAFSLRGLLVVGEVALALVLLAGAGLLLGSFVRLLRVDPGFAPESLLTVNVALPETYRARERIADFYEQSLERIGALPGVQAVGTINLLPLGEMWLRGDFIIEGQPAPAADERDWATKPAVSGDYFRAMNIPLRQGRTFTSRDTAEAPGVVVVSESVARRYFAGGNSIGPVGRRISFDRDRNQQPVWLEVVGVVGDVKQEALGAETRPTIYAPAAQVSRLFMLRDLTYSVRTAVEPASLAAAVEREIQSTDPELPVVAARTMHQVVAASVSEPRFNALLLGLFAALALALAATGLYGVMSYFVTQRTHEIGIRMALGAEARDVLRLVIGQGMKLALGGVAIGLAASFALTRLMKTLLFGMSATDQLTFGVIALLLTSVALLACWIPARRATKVDPMIALRCD